MSLDITVYCKKKPNPADLVTALSAKDYGEIGRRVQYLACNVEDDNRVEIKVDLDPSTINNDYDKTTVDGMIAAARRNGYDIPEGLVQKLNQDGINIFEELSLEYGFDLTTSDDIPYIVKVDEELSAYLMEYPYLRYALLDFSMEFDLVDFSKGEELYSVRLASHINSDVDEASSMVLLAMHIAELYDGILYNPGTDSFGLPDIGNMVKSANDFFERVVVSLEDIVDIPEDKDSIPTVH